MLRRARARARRVGASGDAGISLAELIVAMVLSTILGAITLVLFIDVDNSTSASTDRAIDAAKARTAIQAWTTYLQVSDGPTTGSALNRFEWFSPTNVAFYADLFNRTQASLATTSAPTLVWLRLDSGGQFVEERFTPAPTGFPANYTACRILGSNFTAPKLFTPFGSTGNDLTGLNLGAAQNTAAGCQKLPSTLPSQLQHPDQIAAANLQRVFSVGIDFTVMDTKKTHPLEFNAVASLPVLAGAT